jgi:hypothetical protein
METNWEFICQATAKFSGALALEIVPAQSTNLSRVAGDPTFVLFVCHFVHFFAQNLTCGFKDDVEVEGLLKDLCNFRFSWGVFTVRCFF